VGRWLVILFAACGGGSSPPAIDAPPGGIDAPTGVDAPAGGAEIHFIGRFDGQNRFAWPGSRIATRFDGTTISIDLEDSGQNWFDVSIDGVVQTPPLRPTAGRAEYVLAQGLAAGEHDLVVARRTESFWGITRFHGFPGATLVRTTRTDRLIEFIGDSITCGYGVLGVGPACEFDADTEAETHAWGTLAAAALGADHVAIAYSGVGMVRNFGGDTTNTMPVRYTRTFADDDASTWTYAYIPDVIVIGLGTNDFSIGDPGTPFVDTYVTFVSQLRNSYVTPQIILATSPMLGGADHAAHRGHLDQVVATLADPMVTVVEIAEQDAINGYGCDYHPSEVTQQIMADALVPAIRAVTGW
jgi:lysophospholipase L1-like esterase